MEKRITRASKKKTERHSCSVSCSVSGSLTESHSITTTIPTIPTLESLISVCEERIKERHLSRPKRKRSILTEDTIDKLVLIIDELKELNDIVGLHEVKNTIVEHVLYLAQNLSSDDDMNHIQIVGEPGVGKTTLAYLLGRIYAALGFLENGDVITVTRADLIGEHLGSTSIKTEEMMNACRGNVMFIDEVYAFGCRDRRDSFSKECLDCINQFLSAYRQDLLCIIAGYEEDIKECIFSVNKGLERRFPFKYVLHKYSVDELKRIFITQVRNNEWVIDDSDPVLNTIFTPSNNHYFGSSGGDTEILFLRCKMAHSSRLFLDTKRICEKKKLNSADLKRGFDMFVSMKNVSKVNENVSLMYI